MFMMGLGPNYGVFMLLPDLAPSLNNEYWYIYATETDIIEELEAALNT